MISDSNRVYFFTLLLTFIFIFSHQVAQRLLAISIPFIDSYLDPFLCIPFLLSGFVLERRLLLQIQHFRLNFIEIFTIILVLSLIFEYLFPRLTSEFIYDLCDFLAYAGGGCLFYLLTLMDRKMSK